MKKENKDLNPEIEEELQDETALQEKTEISEIEKVSNELAETKDKYLRLYSEFENFRRRTAKERIELIATANEGLMKDLLPVIDDFTRAKAAMETSDDLEALKEGVNLIHNNFLRILESKGLKAIEAKDKPFDVEYHESVAQFPAGDDKKGIVVDEIEKGYFLNDKVIRYSKVVVGN